MGCRPFVGENVPGQTPPPPGSGGGYAGDRIEPAIEVMKEGEVRYIAFECLAERTIALAQQRKSVDPRQG